MNIFCVDVNRVFIFGREEHSAVHAAVLDVTIIISFDNSIGHSNKITESANGSGWY